MKSDIRAVIVDDEPNSIQLLEDMLNFSSDFIKIVGRAKNVKSGVEVIKAESPDLVFLDIEIPGGNGFSILDACKDMYFQVIFVTGYNQYAIKAIKYSALDYLLKPIDLQELEVAMLRVKSKFKSADHAVQIATLKANLFPSTSQGPTKLDRIVLPQGSGYRVLILSQLVYVEAGGSYTICHLVDGKKQTSTHSLNHFETLLESDDRFFRIHKSHIVNCEYVMSYDKGRGGSIYLQNGFSLPLATRRKNAFVKIMLDSF